MHKPEDYELLRYWHTSSGSFPYYWKDLQIKAAQSNAPLDAIYRNQDGTWATINDCIWTQEKKDQFIREAYEH